jgi:hypothetical protein
VAELHPAAVDEDTTQPGVELVEVAQSGQVLPGGHARVLGRIAGVGVVADDRPRGSEQPVDPRRDERLEGVAVAGSGALDQRRLAVGHHGGARHHGRRASAAIGTLIPT